MFDFKKRYMRNFDHVLLITVLCLCLFGLLSVSVATLDDISEYEGQSTVSTIINIFKNNAESVKDVKVQSISFLIGAFIIALCAFIDYDTFGRLYLFIYAGSNLLLLSVLLFGVGLDSWGAQSWLVIGGFSFQPSEFAKIGIIIPVAKFIEKNHETISEPATLLKVLAFALFPVALIGMQPDFGTAMVFVFFIAVMLYVAGLDLKYFVVAAFSGLLSLPLIWMSLKDYQKKRIVAFLNPETEQYKIDHYQVYHSKIAIGSGQQFGRGVANSKFISGGWLPEKHTDFIFAVIGEVFGFVGGLILILLYALLMYRLVRISKTSKDLFGSLVSIGIMATFLFHIVENIGMTIGLTPVTGIPLPFISSGGTFLLSNLISIGVVFSIALRRDTLMFKDDD